MRLTILILVLFATRIFAQLSPGDLTQPHADLEGVKNCTQCHESGQKLSPEKCFECHTLLSQQINQGKGLHARSDYKTCETCHIEHHGRDFELIYWKDGMTHFDHQLTGYILEGAHKKTECRKCHTSKNIRNPKPLLEKKKDLDRSFLGLAAECLNCHHDEHRGQLNSVCENCHSFDAWKPALKFNHDQAGYPLTGKHITVDCNKCHATIRDQKYTDDADYQKYKGLAFSACTDCHKDVHQNRFGSNCERCHNTSGWADYARGQFNHDLTRYPLLGKHRSLQCTSCHGTGNALKFGGFAQCRDCHKDYHQGQFRLRKPVQDCRECHSVEGFSPALFTIEQHNNGAYPLEGAHLAMPCIVCHKKINPGTRLETIQFRFESKRCAACHNDPHEGTVKKYVGITSALTGMDGCEHCHEVKSWSQIQFDHSGTPFILEGKHATTACIECHKKSPVNVAIPLNTAEKDCQSCHQDIHYGQFATDKSKNVTPCMKCHTPENWIAQKFDHNKDTSFRLTGAHEKVNCDRCHKVVRENDLEFVRYKPMKSDCTTCHGSKL